jgi:hypothetical protein
VRGDVLSGVRSRPRWSLARALASTTLPAAFVGASAAATALLSSGGIHPPGAAGTDDAPRDRPPAALSGAPWVLRADRLVLRASTFHGVVSVPTRAGTERVVKFTARAMDIAGLDLTTGAGGVRLRARPATTSIIRGKDAVTLYARSLSGSLTGLGGAPLPAIRRVTITPDALPSWLSHPGVPRRTVTFEDVTVAQVGQFNGDLAIAGPDLSTGQMRPPGR